MKTILEIKHLSKKFANYAALRDINFEIGQGEIVGFLGPSGAGKTTTIKIVTGQLRQTSGTATLLGRDSKQLTHEIYKEIGIVSDNSGIYERISVYDNLLLFAKLLEVSTSYIDQLLKRIGLYDQRKQKAEKLSRGQKQRLILIRALLHKPKILFLDEPTSGLDPSTTLEVHKVLFELKEQGMAIFLTTHDMQEATKLCDRVALINDGEIVEYGTPKELCLKYHTDKHYSVLLDNQTEVVTDDNEEAVKKIADWLCQGRLQSIHSSEPTLETVFLTVTGRELA
ncbi:ABC-2 type transport system ATP-binding protein [Enterococcus sp. AZ194]|uniref:ABC transporter ATP-binding protein n=1 Tax=Enterococcus sp. AZ194 TaxID=2774629 RepID=UPI003F1EB7A3